MVKEATIESAIDNESYSCTTETVEVDIALTGKGRYGLPEKHL